MTTLLSRPRTTGVQLVGLAKSFGTVQAVRGVDITVAPGETVALLGPNGARKSTTIDMLLGLTRPDRAGSSLGVRLPASDWVTMTFLILIGLIPFAVLGILLGHLLTVDSMGPALGGLTALFALLGGAWGPITSSGVLHRLAEALPSYWLVQPGSSAVGGSSWPTTAWLVIASWTVGLGALTVQVYKRDTARA